MAGMAGSIEQAVRDGPPHSTGWFLRIAFSSRNQMDMRMHDFLSRDYSAVGADVEPRHRLVALQNLRTQLKQQFVGIFPLLRRHREKILGMPARDDQQVAIGGRILVLDGKDAPVNRDGLLKHLGFAKRTHTRRLSEEKITVGIAYPPIFDRKGRLVQAKITGGIEFPACVIEMPAQTKFGLVGRAGVEPAAR